MTVQYSLCIFIALFCLHISFYGNAKDLHQVTIDEDNIILLDVVLNNITISRSIDAYMVDNELLVAVEPLFEGLKIRYKVNDEVLTVWKDNVSYQYPLIKKTKNLAIKPKPSERWATDDFYFFIDLALFKELFPSKMAYLPKRLQLKVTTPEKSTLFPLQKIQKQNKLRANSQFHTGNRSYEEQRIPITIPDQYRLFTVPHGRINLAVEKNNFSESLNTSMQLTSDLLYHSASLTLSDTIDTDLSARLTLSRYKETPDDYILGVYDEYNIGDVSGRTNSLISKAGSGVGFTLNRQPNEYRYDSQSITLQEIAPPGWEVELFHNNAFIETTTVPDDGLLTFEDVDVIYGNNTYLIKLYGPYGEEKSIIKKIDLSQNPLGKGQFAHSLYALDTNHKLINDQTDTSYEINNYGASFDYGLHDAWQVGIGFSELNDVTKFFNVKNAVTFPGISLENDISIDQDGNYAQLTSILGGAFDQDTYSLSLSSAKNYHSDRIQSTGKSSNYKASYHTPMKYAGLSFDVNYGANAGIKQFGFSNRLIGNLKSVRYTHSISYSKSTYSNPTLESDTVTEATVGSLGLSGTLPFAIRVNGKINYNPIADSSSDILLPSSSLNIQKNIKDPWGSTHYLSLKYLPLNNENNKNIEKWRLSHRVSWQKESFRLNYAAHVNDNDDWAIQLGLQFFIGYDHRNNSLSLNNKIHNNTASLDVHTYLDRQINGEPDPLDYNLTGVEFTGSSQWDEFKSGNDGRVILPGVHAQTPFRFNAHWQDGSNTINNDYVVYTHPGAYVDVNMPFIMSTDFEGFVLRSKSGYEKGIQNTLVQLIDNDGKVLAFKKTDIDGFYEFVGIPPGSYLIRVAEDSLLEKNITSDVVGVRVSTSGNAGYVEVPSFKFRRVKSDNIKGSEAISLLTLTDDNSESVVWDDDEYKRRNHFTLPTREIISAKHSLTQFESDERNEDKKIERNNLDNRTVFVKKSINNPLLLAKNLAVGQLPIVKISHQNTVNKNITADVSKNTNVIVQPMIREGYTIQLGAFTQRKDAERAFNSLHKAPLLSNQFTLNRDARSGIYKLTYGSFIDKSEANRFAESNIPKNQGYYIRSSLVNNAVLNSN